MIVKIKRSLTRSLIFNRSLISTCKDTFLNQTKKDSVTLSFGLGFISLPEIDL